MTDQPTDWRTDGLIGKLHFPKESANKKGQKFTELEIMSLWNSFKKDFPGKEGTVYRVFHKKCIFSEYFQYFYFPFTLASNGLTDVQMECVKNISL